jgi:reactive intermediate/imine deaminase
MADIRLLNSPDLCPPAGHYSHVCIAGGLVHISGQLPVDERGNALSESPFEEQVKRVLANIDACLSTAGTTKEDLVQVRVYVTDANHWPAFNRLYAAWIGEHRPARAIAGVSSLHYGVMVEVEATALAR